MLIKIISCTDREIVGITLDVDLDSRIFKFRHIEFNITKMQEEGEYVSISCPNFSIYALKL
mgnify:CR=1 FL=1